MAKMVKQSEPFQVATSYTSFFGSVQSFLALEVKRSPDRFRQTSTAAASASLHVLRLHQPQR